MWSFSEEEKELINNEKKCKFLPNVKFPDNVYCTTSFEEAIEGTEIIIHVTPSKFTRDTAKQYKQYVKDQIVIICSKGFPNSKIAVLSGPSHAEEVSKDIPTALVVASKYDDVNELIQEEFMSKSLRIYTCKDIKGVELRRSVKKYNCILCRSCSRSWTGR